MIREIGIYIKCGSPAAVRNFDKNVCWYFQYIYLRLLFISLAELVVKVKVFTLKS